MISEDQINTEIGNFIAGLVPGVEVVVGQVNRVPEPASPDFVVMWPILRERLATNHTEFVDALFEGSITSDTLTITHVNYGSIDVGSPVFGEGVLTNTFVTERITGIGGVGDYKVSKAQEVTIRVIAAGQRDDTVPTKLTIQADIHGPSSADNVQRILTLFRSDYATDIMINVVPLYTSDPRQMPFINAEQQIENRWSIDLVMQVNPTVVTPQQFFDDALIDNIVVTINTPADEQI